MFKNIHSSYHFQQVLFFFIAWLVCSPLFSEELPDSLHRRKLKEVVVNGHQLQIVRASLPEQIKSEHELTTLNAANVAEVAKLFSGVILKDYGGIGGLKTVSLRGMGAQHTGVCYDGLIMSDIQSGEVDLGRLTIDNISEISLCNGQPNDIFQTARMFASVGILNLKTKFPENNGNQRLQGIATFKTGSFGLLDAGFFLMQNMGTKWAFNFSLDGQMADGKYKFIEYYGNKTNSSEILTRENADIRSLRSEINLLYRIRPKENITLKSNFFQSERGLPGAVIWYNTESNERLQDKTFFTQIHYENRLSDKLHYQSFAKFNSGYNCYRNQDNNYENGILKESVLQKEYYLSTGLRYTPVCQLQLSASADWWYNDLQNKSNNVFDVFQFPTRHTGLANLAAKYMNERITLGANVLYTLTREKVRTGEASPDRDKLSPTVSASYKLLDDKEFRLRAFYKNIFRVPTFNELYYVSLGNHNLRPENANQIDIGFKYLETTIPFISELECSIDGYFNRVTDKIIAIPQDLFHWSMTNKGLVDIKGFDANMKVVTPVIKSDELIFRFTYNYNEATDLTSGSANYGEQIPYTPYYSGSGSASYHHGMWEGGYNLFFSGKQWIGQNISANRIDAYSVHSLFATSYFRNWKLTGEIINIFNTQYEVYKFYPMPRRNFRITVSKDI